MEPLKREIHRRQQSGSLPKHVGVLLIGETGSGKSTFINYVTNFFQNGSLAKPKIAIPTLQYSVTEGSQHSEQDLKHNFLSHTKGCNRYDFYVREETTNETTNEEEEKLEDDSKVSRPEYDVQFFFIDTAGFSDTKGSAADRKTTKKIFITLGNLPWLNVIAIFQNGMQQKSTKSKKETIRLIQDILPNSVRDNLILVLTHCTEDIKTFDVKELHPLQFPKQNVFYMQNSAFVADKDELLGDSELFKKTEKKWKKSMDTLSKLLTRLLDFEAMSVDNYKALNEKKEKIRKEIADMKVKLDNALQVYKHTKMEVSSKSPDYDKLIPQQKVVVMPYYSTMCSNHQAEGISEKVCHEDCGLPFHPGQKHPQFEECVCMLKKSDTQSTRTCNVCGCGFEHHYHSKHHTITFKTKLRDCFLKGSELTVDYKAQNDLLEHSLNEIKNAFESIKSLCLEIRDLCSHFDLQTECSILLEWIRYNKDAETYSMLQDQVQDFIKFLADLTPPDNMTPSNDVDPSMTS